MLGDASGPPVVLVVDDDPTVRELVTLAVSGAGFPVRAAACGADAVALYRDHRGEIGLVLLDVLMPGMDGPATLEALRRLDLGVRCCFLSAYPGRATREDLLARGALEYVEKPFRVAELVGVVRRLARPAGGNAAGASS